MCLQDDLPALLLIIPTAAAEVELRNIRARREFCLELEKETEMARLQNQMAKIKLKTAKIDLRFEAAKYYLKQANCDHKDSIRDNDGTEIGRLKEELKLVEEEVRAKKIIFEEKYLAVNPNYTRQQAQEAANTICEEESLVSMHQTYEDFKVLPNKRDPMSSGEEDDN